MVEMKRSPDQVRQRRYRIANQIKRIGPMFYRVKIAPFFLCTSKFGFCEVLTEPYKHFKHYQTAFYSKFFDRRVYH